jgi:hypothetical protein
MPESPRLMEPGAGARARRPRGRRALQRQRWDRTVVGVLTPTLVVGLIGGTFLLGQIFYPDPDPPTLVFPTPRPSLAAREDAAPTPMVRVSTEPIDTVKVNEGIVDRPLAFDWPEVDDLKVVPNPGRPSEQADYKPALAALETRRLFDASSVSIVQHSMPPQAQGAATELAKAFPLRARKQQVLDLSAMAGYLPDDTGYGVVFSYGGFRTTIETMATGPIREAQRAEIEYHTLHLADHIARHLQEVASSGSRTGPEARAVHWRDHLVRSLSLGR